MIHYLMMKFENPPSLIKVGQLFACLFLKLINQIKAAKILNMKLTKNVFSYLIINLGCAIPNAYLKYTAFTGLARI